MTTWQGPQGIFPPVPTIFDQDGKLDSKGMGQLLDSLIQQQVHGLLILGTTGEFSQLHLEEREHIAQFCVKHVNGRVPVWIGTGCNATQDAIRLTQHAEQIGATGAVIINPYYNKLSRNTLSQYFSSILKSTQLPCMLYNFPALTGQDLDPIFVRDLAAHHANLVGIKETVDQLSHIRQMITEVKRVKPDFSVFCGFDEYLLATLAAGGDGAIVAGANFAPQLMIGVYNNFRSNNLAKLLEFHHQIIQLPPIYQIDQPFVPAIKEAIRLTGVPISNSCLSPTSGWDNDKTKQLERILVNANIEHGVFN